LSRSAPTPDPDMGKGGNLEAPSLGAAFSWPKRQPRGRSIKTAAAHRPPPNGLGAPWEEDKWLALGETRRAAATCKTTSAMGGNHPFSLAKGPDGTKGFRMHRTARREPPSAGEGVIGRVWTYVWQTPMSPTTFALLMLSAASFVLMVLVLFSKLAVTAAFLMWIVYFYQAPWLKRLGGYMLTTGLVSGGLVILCLGLDLSLGLMGYTATTLLSLTEQHIRLIILGSAMVFLPVIVAPEGGGSTGVLRENVNVIFSHRQHETRPARFLVVHREAGRLRRKVAATLFFKVFDPGGQLICLQGSSCF
jgi:hypothetical protein